MKYFSTRGPGDELSFEETVLTGLAPDGGLFIPTQIPTLPENWQTEWKDYTFQQLSLAVLSLYISPPEIPASDLKNLIDKSYQSFRHPDVTPLVKLQDGLYILELWHGPTYAFKDVALQLLGNLFEYFLARRNAKKSAGEAREKLTVVGATSGDTGSAAIYGLRNKADISIFILHPKGRVSPIQEAQMTTVSDPNVFNLAVQGTFDDCQSIVKSLFADREFNATHKLGAINSINWARILAQTVYYFLAYFHVQRQLPAAPNGEPPRLQFVVPTGNFGDILAGYYATRMGLPVAASGPGLGIATNSNDILTRFWATGRYEMAESSGLADGTRTPNATQPVNGASDGKQAPVSGTVKETLSPAMDILISSNFERLLWYLAYESLSLENTSGQARRAEACKTVAGLMHSVKVDGTVSVSTSIVELARRDFTAERVDDAETLSTIKQFYSSKPSYIADPHTAVGLTAARKIKAKQSSNGSPAQPVTQIVLSTAHPAKFSEAVVGALQAHQPQFDFERDVLPDDFKGLLEKPRRIITVPAPKVDLVKGVIVEKLGQSGAAEQEPVGPNMGSV